MNRRIVSDVASPSDLTTKKGNLPFVKVHSIGSKVLEKYSPIAKGKVAAEVKKNLSPRPRQKRVTWTEKVRRDRSLFCCGSSSLVYILTYV